MNIEAAWDFLETHRMNREHAETHEGAQGTWVTDIHGGYVCRPCKVCGDIFICTPDSDATDCGDSHLKRVG